jgi:hypothetical protein
MDQRAGSLDALLELAARQAAEGQGDAPWPPHYRKQPGEAPRVAPSRRRNAKNPAEDGSRTEGRSHKEAGSRRRTSKHPLIEIGRAQRKADALAGVDRWKTRHADAAAYLQPADILVDAMRGRFHTWTRTRINLQHVPPELRPDQEPLDPDENPMDEWNGVAEWRATRPGKRS